jgi:hypothetical protein
VANEGLTMNLDIVNHAIMITSKLSAMKSLAAAENLLIIETLSFETPELCEL